MGPAKTTPRTGAVTLSICIPTYNRACYLDSLLGELAAQIGELQHSYELLIGDNCSSDITEQAVARHQDKLNIRYFRRPSNLDPTESLNQFYRSAQGKYTLYHASGDLFILVEVNKNLEISGRNAAVGVIFAPWFIHDLPTRQDITPFCHQDDNYLIEQHDHAKLLALTLPYHTFPEIYLVRREVPDQLYFVAPERAFWAFARAAEMLRSYALYFSKTSLYRSVTCYFDNETHAQAGNKEVKYAWDRYCDGLEYMLGKFALTLALNERQERLNVINQFVLARTKIVLRLYAQEGGHWIGNYYIVNRIKALGEVGDLSAPHDLYRVSTTSEYVAKFDPFKPKPPRYAALRCAPLQVSHHAHGFADAEFVVPDDGAIIPRYTVTVTPIPMDIAVSVGREVHLVSELETLVKFP